MDLNLNSAKEIGLKPEHYKRFAAHNISEIMTTKDGRDEEYVVADFEEKEEYASQIRFNKKVFFKTTHSRMFDLANEARDNGTPEQLKIMGIKLNLECNPYKVIIDGKQQMDGDGNEVIASNIGLFLMPAENAFTEYRRALRRLEFVEIAGEGIDAEENKADALAGK